MRTSILIGGILLGAMNFVSAATNDLTSALQRGLFEEEANLNLGAAIQAYQTVANQFDKDRKLAATAIFRLGECYRKQENTNEAAVQYERILREFSDQPTLVTLSRQNLANLGSAPPPTAAPVLSDAARQEQKRLLEEEIKLVQKQLDTQKKQVQVGVIGLDALLPTQRDLLQLRRQLAAVDAGLPVAMTPTETSTPAASTEADEVRRVQALIKDSPDLINAPDRRGETLLDAAAANGKLTAAKLLLDNGAAVDGLQQPGLTALHYAAANGHKAIVDLLLSKGAKPGAQTGNGVTPLHLAARKGYEEVVKTLLAAGAPVNAAPKELGTSDTEDLQYRISAGQTPLHLTAIAGYAGVVELLLAKGADVNAVDIFGRTPLSYAVDKHYQPVVQLLLTAHANPNAGSSDLPLTVAAYYGDMPALKLLLANGADPNINTNVSSIFRGTYGQPYDWRGKLTPLAVAVNQKRADAVAELIGAKADPNGTGPDGTPLIFFALSDPPTLKALLAGGADPNPMTRGMTPLLSAVSQGLQPAVELLLAHKAGPNFARPDNGLTPLHEAAQQGNKTIAELLLKAGANVNARDRAGSTPLHEPAYRGLTDMAALLLANKADPNAKRDDGWTPLHLAVYAGKQETAELLLANKADPNERNKQGQTPLDFAKNRAQSPGPGMPVTVGSGMPGTLTISATPLPPGSLSPPGISREQVPKPETMADLLRRHGALDDLPHLDQIGVRRGTIGFSETVFAKATQDWNQFTLLELLAAQYKLLASSPNIGGGSSYGASALFGKASLAFPDLAHLHISRPSADLKSWQDRVVDLTPVVDSGDCAKDVRLRWGDVVEVPEADHPLNERWKGFSSAQLSNLRKCLTRKVEIVVKGQATTVTLAPKITGLEGDPERGTPVIPQAPYQGGPVYPQYEPTIYTLTPFWLRPVLLQSKLVLISSDLDRVKVTRRDPATGQTHEWVVDCSKNGDSSPDFWLQNGDRVEVPEKTYGSAAPAEGEQPPPPGMPLPPQPAGPGGTPYPVSPLRPPSAAPAGPAMPGAPQLPARTLRMPATPAPPQAAPPLSYQRRIDQPQMPPPAPRPTAPEPRPPEPGGVRYSPKATDSALLDAGYQRDRSARTRKAEAWEERAESPLSGRASDTAIWTGTEMIVFGGEGMGASCEDGARYCPAEDTWAMLPQKGAPSSRTGHTAVWTGKEMLVWGGFGGASGDNVNHNDGARYNPASDTWKPVSTRNAPTARFDFQAVWTGKEMLVWGGYTDSHSRYQGGHADAHLNTGGRYDPATDTWKPITTRGAPSKRCGHSMVWTGKEMIVWGGANADKVLNDGGRYNPARDSWRPISTDGAPSPRGNHVAVWTGKEMIVWGGGARDPSTASDYFENGARYNPETDTWKPISGVGAPKGRVCATAIWTGTEMVVWGGLNDAQAAGDGNSSRFVGTGARYNPATDAWAEITVTGAPTPRLTSGVWTGDGLLIFGGYNETHLNDTWFYSPQRTLYPYARR